MISTIKKTFHTIMNTITFGGYNYLKEAIGFETNRNRTAMININNGLAKATIEQAKEWGLKSDDIAAGLEAYKKNTQYYMQQKINNDVFFDIRDIYSTPPKIKEFAIKYK